MSDRRNPPTDEQRTQVTQSAADGALDATGVYEDGDVVVLYDTEDPLAWVQADNAVPLSETV